MKASCKCTTKSFFTLQNSEGQFLHELYNHGYELPLTQTGPSWVATTTDNLNLCFGCTNPGGLSPLEQKDYLLFLKTDARSKKVLKDFRIVEVTIESTIKVRNVI